ncbi:hypothetical protein LY78DRAFT_66161 [Colletotrichum sublineola]|nr:hypothetical protein LY78DRAFT_66161 [Colletotrichum sublineola]
MSRKGGGVLMSKGKTSRSGYVLRLFGVFNALYFYFYFCLCSCCASGRSSGIQAPGNLPCRWLSMRARRRRGLVKTAGEHKERPPGSPSC